MIDEVRVCGRKLFHHDMWRVLINGHKWLYDANNDCFIEKVDGQVVAKKDMPLSVQLGFTIAWDGRALCEKYSRRRSYGWKLMLANLHAEGYDIVVYSRGRRMGVTRLSHRKNPLTSIPIAPVLV